MLTGLYAGILALIYAGLSFMVVRERISSGIRMGDDGNDGLRRLVRVHGNFVEYTPFTLLLMAFYEMQGGSLYALHAMGLTLIIARLLHVVGLRRDIVPARAAGTILTLLLFIILGVILILKGIRFMQVV